MESETTTWEIEAPETKHLKNGNRSPRNQASQRRRDRSSNRNSIIILPADKGNATVVMDRVEYSKKLADLIGNGGYCKVKKDPTLKTEKKLS